jgi:hypothetical protein
MTITAEEIAAAIDKVEHLADLDRRGNYAPLLDRLERELRAVRRQRRAAMVPDYPPENPTLRARAHH